MKQSTNNPSDQLKGAAATPLAFIIPLLLVAVIGLVLYWSTLKLPLLYDDLLHIRITKGLDFGSLWLPTQAFGFYRPLTFLPLLIIKQVFGYYPAGFLHGLNVFQHALNGLLLALLVWRLWRKRHWALASGALFVLFPFSYQAIAVYGHNVHPTTAGLLLLGLHTYLAALRSGARRALWWLLTAVIFILGLLSHESAVLFGPFAALVQWNEQGQLPQIELKNPVGTLKSLTRQPWFLFLAAGLAYLVFYQFLPLTRAPQAGYSGGTWLYKGLYLAQALVYPVAWLGRLIPYPYSTPVSAAVISLGLLIVVGLTLWSAHEPVNRLPLILGWGWWALASLVIAVPLSADYLLHGPRLLYVSSIGLAILWPVLLEPIWRLPRFGRWLWFLILAFVLLTSWLFVRDRLIAYRQLTSPIKEVKETLADRPGEEGVLLVNLPNWLAPTRNTYPIGVEIVAMMGDYLFVEELIGENMPGNRPAQAFLVPDLLENAAYNYGIHQESDGELIRADWAPDGSHVFITRFTPSGPVAFYTGRFETDANQDEPLAIMGPYELLAAEAQSCGDQVDLNTTWRISSGAESVAPTTSLFVQLLAEDGQLSAQNDGPPLGLRPDLIDLPGGWQIVDQRSLPATGSEGTILLGAYDFATGQRLAAVSGTGQPLPDDGLLLSVSDCP